MNKRIYIMLLTLMCSIISMATPITQEQALITAQTLLNCKLHATPLSSPSLRRVSSLSNNSLPVFYFFDTEDGARVIVAADDCAYPILGYFDHIPDSQSEMPDNLLNWLEGYARQIEYARVHQLKASEDVLEAWNTVTAQSFSPRRLPYTKGPMMTTLWNQSYPYNIYVPGGYPTGCVATAMSQIMRYWQYPKHGTGERAYMRGDQLYKADFAATTYNWSLMPDYLTDESSEEQIDAVATLMYQCGVATRMMYNTDGSGTYVIESYSQRGDDCAEYAFRTFFGYDPSMQGIMRDRKSSSEAYTDDEWSKMIREEIDSARPVLYSGYGKDENEAYYGHAFVCDGYTSLGLYHFNWGWSGAYDGWFKLNALNLSGVGIGGGTGEFNYLQHAIFNLKPMPNENDNNEETDLEDLRDLEGLKDINVYVYDICGKLVSEEYMSEFSLDKLNNSELLGGIYIINLRGVNLTRSLKWHIIR